MSRVFGKSFRGTFYARRFALWPTTVVDLDSKTSKIWFKVYVAVRAYNHAFDCRMTHGRWSRAYFEAQRKAGKLEESGPVVASPLHT